MLQTFVFQTDYVVFDLFFSFSLTFQNGKICSDCSLIRSYAIALVILIVQSLRFLYQGVQKGFISGLP